MAKTYDRGVIERLGGSPILIERIDRLELESGTTRFGDVHVGHKIEVGGSAIISIDAILNNVTQTIGTAQPGLDPKQKSDLEPLVQSLKKRTGLATEGHSRRRNQSDRGRT